MGTQTESQVMTRREGSGSGTHRYLEFARQNWGERSDTERKLQRSFRPKGCHESEVNDGGRGPAARAEDGKPAVACMLHSLRLSRSAGRLSRTQAWSQGTQLNPWRLPRNPRGTAHPQGSDMGDSWFSGRKLQNTHLNKSSWSGCY